MHERVFVSKTYYEVYHFYNLDINKLASPKNATKW